MTTSADGHDAFLRELFLAREGPAAPAASIRLVSRLQHPSLLGSVPTSRVFLFIPDMHLISDDAQARFQYGFRQIAPGVPSGRDALLKAVMAAALRFKKSLPNGQSLAVYQLGDFFDLWREGRYVGGNAPPVGQLAHRIQDSYRYLIPRLVDDDQDGSLEAELILGNHDEGLEVVRGFEQDVKALAPPFKSLGGRRPVLITHGDAFDRLEGLDDVTQSLLIARFGEGHHGGVYPAFPDDVPYLVGCEGPSVLTEPTPSAALDAVVNVREAPMTDDVEKLRDVHEMLVGLPPASFMDIAFPPDKVDGLIAAMPKIRRGEGDQYRNVLNAEHSLPAALPDVRVVVVGHSHHPRMVVVGDPASPTSFLLMDCGAWMEQIEWPGGDRLTSCQIGVLCGDDARIYQLDPAEPIV